MKKLTIKKRKDISKALHSDIDFSKIQELNFQNVIVTYSGDVAESPIMRLIQACSNVTTIDFSGSNVSLYSLSNISKTNKNPKLNRIKLLRITNIYGVEELSSDMGAIYKLFAAGIRLKVDGELKQRIIKNINKYAKYIEIDLEKIQD